MPKAPAFQFYTGDWLKDPALQACSPATRGIWINLIACMWEAKQRGTVIGTPQELSRLANANLTQLKQFLNENTRHGFADVVNENGVISISCRRMIREEKQREYERNKKRGQRSVPEDVPEVSPHCPGNVPVPSSSSSSSSSSDKKEYAPDFDEWWKGYPNKQGRDRAATHYATRRGSGQTREQLLIARDRYIRSKDGDRQPVFANGSTFLNPKPRGDSANANDFISKPSPLDGKSEEEIRDLFREGRLRRDDQGRMTLDGEVL